jgi:uncharacterized phage-associated protein
MATVHDVAQYVLGLKSGMSAMKLQKLVYYCQAWHLVWDDEPLFKEEIQAWANGPVVEDLYDLHRGRFDVTAPWPRGDLSQLTSDQKLTIDAVLRSYGDLTGQQLSELTHREDPWRNTRAGMGVTERSKRRIPNAVIAEYYSTIAASEQAQAIGEAFESEPDFGPLDDSYEDDFDL